MSKPSMKSTSEQTASISTSRQPILRLSMKASTSKRSLAIASSPEGPVVLFCPLVAD
jgi:hypothetical protein